MTDGQPGTRADEQAADAAGISAPADAAPESGDPEVSELPGVSEVSGAGVPEDLLASALRAHAAQASLPPVTDDADDTAEPEQPAGHSTGGTGNADNAEGIGDPEDAAGADSTADGERTDQENLLAKALRAQAVRAAVPTTPARPAEPTAAGDTDTIDEPDTVRRPGTAAEESGRRTRYVPVLGSAPATLEPYTWDDDTAERTDRGYHPPAGATGPVAAVRPAPRRVAAGWILLLAVTLGLAAGTLAALFTLL